MRSGRRWCPLRNPLKRADRAFIQGYVCAVATLVKAHGEDTYGAELLRCIGAFTKQDVCEYDWNILRQAGLV